MSIPVTVATTRLNELIDWLNEAQDFARAIELMASNQMGMPKDVGGAVGQVVIELQARIGTTGETLAELVEDAMERATTVVPGGGRHEET